MVDVTVGICPVCNDKGVVLTEHHVVEAPNDEEGRVRVIMICQKCHDNYNLYRNALIKLKIEIDRTKLAQML